MISLVALDKRDASLNAFFNTTEPTQYLNQSLLDRFNECQCTSVGLEHRSFNSYLIVKGHEGRLCGTCSEEYGEFDLQCFKCASKAVILLWLLGATVWHLGTCSVNVIGNLTDIRRLHRSEQHVLRSTRRTGKANLKLYQKTSFVSLSDHTTLRSRQSATENLTQHLLDHTHKPDLEGPSQLGTTPFQRPERRVHVPEQDRTKLDGVAELPPIGEMEQVHPTEVDTAKRHVTETFKVRLSATSA